MNEKNVKPFNLAILASGEGSTGEVLFDKANLVIASNPQAGIIDRIKKYNQKNNNRLSWETVSRAAFRDRAEFGQALIRVLKKYHINFISQNGWTVFTSENILNEYKGRIINSHPGPLDLGYPDFGGKGMNDLAVHSAAIYFKKNIKRDFKTEICLHLVTSEFDKGELVGFREVDVSNSDTPQILQQRVKEAERELLKDFWGKVEKEGEIKVIKREKRVIQKGEEEVLKEAKQAAYEKYSKV